MVITKQGNGFGSVYKLSGRRRNPWIARVTVGYEPRYDEQGNPIRPKQLFKTIGYFRTRREGIIALAKYNDDPDYYNVKIDKPTFREMCDMAMQDYERRGLNESTIRIYGYTFNRLDVLMDKEIDKIKRRDIQQIFDDMQEQGMARNTMNLTKNVINSVFDLAIKKEYIDKSPANLIDINSDKKKRVKTPFTPQEMELVYKNLSYNRLAPTVLIMLFTGMRIGELLTLKKENVKLDERYMIGGIKTKAGKDRIIPIHNFILPYIEAYMNDESNTSEYLIVSKTNTSIYYENYIVYFFYPFLHSLGIEHTPHECRHTFISMTSGRQFDQTRIKRIVGHKTNDITVDVYTHFYIEELIEEIDKLEVPFKIE